MLTHNTRQQQQQQPPHKGVLLTVPTMILFPLPDCSKNTRGNNLVFALQIIMPSIIILPLQNCSNVQIALIATLRIIILPLQN